jgi:hypothetical protein
VHHEPQLLLVVGLHFEEVVAAAERSELDLHVASARRCSAFVGELDVAVAAFRLANGRHASAQLREQPRRGLLGVERDTRRVEAEHQHAAADVAADGLRVGRVRRSDDRADAHVFGEVHVGHHRDVVHARSLGESFERVRYGAGSGSASQRCTTVIVHLRPAGP